MILVRRAVTFSKSIDLPGNSQANIINKNKALIKYSCKQIAGDFFRRFVYKAGKTGHVRERKSF
jgi:hypothetical protein